MNLLSLLLAYPSLSTLPMLTYREAVHSADTGISMLERKVFENKVETMVIRTFSPKSLSLRRVQSSPHMDWNSDGTMLIAEFGSTTLMLSPTKGIVRRMLRETYPSSDAQIKKLHWHPSAANVLLEVNTRTQDAALLSFESMRAMATFDRPSGSGWFSGSVSKPSMVKIDADGVRKVSSAAEATALMIEPNRQPRKVSLQEALLALGVRADVGQFVKQCKLWTGMDAGPSYLPRLKSVIFYSQVDMSFPQKNVFFSQEGTFTTHYVPDINDVALGKGYYFTTTSYSDAKVRIFPRGERYRDGACIVNPKTQHVWYLPRAKPGLEYGRIIRVIDHAGFKPSRIDPRF